MTNLSGTYAEEDEGFEYVCRVFWWGEGRNIKWFNGVNEPVEIRHGDVLKILGKGTWAALYRRPFESNVKGEGQPPSRNDAIGRDSG